MVRRSCTALFLIVVLVVLISCKRASGNDEGIVFWTPSAVPTQTERIIEITTTPVFIEITTTPSSTGTATPETYLCVSAQEAVHLRPSASIDNYPIVVLKNGEKVTDLGGRNGKWWFVQIRDKQGWINSDFVENCK